MLLHTLVSLFYFPELTYILLAVGQSVEFTSHLLVNCQKTELRFLLKYFIFYLILRNHCPYCNHEIKMGVTVLVFALRTNCIPWAFQNGLYMKGRRKILWNLHRDITIRTELVIKIRIQKGHFK